MAQSFLNFAMYLIKYINYIKHNKSNCISWGKWKGKADGVANILNTTFPLNWYQLDNHITETALTFCKDFTRYKIVSKEDSSAWCHLLRIPVIHEVTCPFLLAHNRLRHFVFFTEILYYLQGGDFVSSEFGGNIYYMVTCDFNETEFSVLGGWHILSCSPGMQWVGSLQW